VGGERPGRAEERAAGLRAVARRVLARVPVARAEEVGDEALAAVLLEVARHAEVGEEEVERRAVRVGGGGGGAAVTAGPAAAARELHAAGAARQMPHRALDATNTTNRRTATPSEIEICRGEMKRDGAKRASNLVDGRRQRAGAQRAVELALVHLNRGGRRLLFRRGLPWAGTAIASAPCGGASPASSSFTSCLISWVPNRSGPSLALLPLRLRLLLPGGGGGGGGASSSLVRLASPAASPWFLSPKGTRPKGERAFLDAPSYTVPLQSRGEKRNKNRFY